MTNSKLFIRCERKQEEFTLTDPIHRKFLEQDLELWYAPLAPLRSVIKELEKSLDSGERERAQRFHFAKDKERFVIGHYLLRHILAEYTSSDPAGLVFSRMQFGKPFLREHPELHFNFSDTRDSILVGVSKLGPVGVDIETLTRDVDYAGVADHFFTGPEIEALQNDADPKLLFLEYWTRKEAILKASGIGIMEDVRVLKVNATEQTVQISHKDMIALSSDQYFVNTGKIGDQNILSYASPEPLDCAVVFDALQL